MYSELLKGSPLPPPPHAPALLKNSSVVPLALNRHATHGEESERSHIDPSSLMLQPLLWISNIPFYYFGIDSFLFFSKEYTPKHTHTHRYTPPPLLPIKLLYHCTRDHPVSSKPWASPFIFLCFTQCVCVWWWLACLFLMLLQNDDETIWRLAVSGVRKEGKQAGSSTAA